MSALPQKRRRVVSAESQNLGEWPLPADGMEKLAIDDSSFLAEFPRLRCSRGCGKKHKHFCCECGSRLEHELSERIPRVSLPVRLDIVHHPHEKKSKSTAVHALTLAPPEQVRWMEYDSDFRADDWSPENTLLLFPSDDATPVHELSDDEIANVKTLVVVDSTWFQCGGILANKQLQSLKKVKFAAQKTLFWRHQSNASDYHLATIEAIYYVMRALHLRKHGSYAGEQDNLLFFFKYYYDLIQQRYSKNASLRLHSHLPQDYIRARAEASSTSAAASNEKKRSRTEPATETDTPGD
ncbi:MAG: hypothetical protein MHM6MM_005179 [Cercozoa sp. M6MM]